MATFLSIFQLWRRSIAFYEEGGRFFLDLESGPFRFSEEVAEGRMRADDKNFPQLVVPAVRKI